MTPESLMEEGSHLTKLFPFLSTLYNASNAQIEDWLFNRIGFDIDMQVGLEQDDLHKAFRNHESTAASVSKYGVNEVNERLQASLKYLKMLDGKIGGSCPIMAKNNTLSGNCRGLRGVYYLKEYMPEAIKKQLEIVMQRTDLDPNEKINEKEAVTDFYRNYTKLDVKVAISLLDEQLKSEGFNFELRNK